MSGSITGLGIKTTKSDIANRQHAIRKQRIQVLQGLEKGKISADISSKRNREIITRKANKPGRIESPSESDSDREGRVGTISKYSAGLHTMPSEEMHKVNTRRRDLPYREDEQDAKCSSTEGNEWSNEPDIRPPHKDKSFLDEVLASRRMRKLKKRRRTPKVTKSNEASVRMKPTKLD